MATIYFTNNANSGAGSLRQAVADAADGDVIAPDPTVFAAGESVAIVLTGGLSVNKSLTISGGATKLTISTVSPDSSYALYFPVGAGTICLEDLTVVGRVNAFAEVNIARRCFFGGNAANAHGVQGTTNSVVRLYDCVVTGFRRYGVYTVGAESEQTLVRSTTVGNGLGNYHPANAAYTETDSIVDPVPSSAGFVAPPPDALDASTALPWEDWNLRLLPTSPYATGATPAAGEYDVEGNARGRTVGAATTYAVGAYERSDDAAAVYWARTTNPSFDEPSDWAYDAEKTSVVVSLVSPACYVLDATGTTLSDAPPPSAFLVVETGVAISASADMVVKTLNLQRGASLAIAAGAFVSTTELQGVAASVSASSRAYFAAPPSANVAAHTFGANVVVCEYGANVSRVKATEDVVFWSATDPSVSVLVETQTDGAWTTLAQTAGTSAPATLAKGTPVRVFDGAKFLTVSASFLHAWLEYTQTITVATAVAKAYDAVVQSVPRYNIKKGFVMASQYYNRGEAPVFFARIEDSETSAIVPKSAVSSISYSAYRVTNSWSTEKRTPVEGHENVAVDLAAYLDALVTDDPRWTEDETGYNFIFEPDTTEYPIFPDGGKYVVVVTIEFTGANPAPISYEVEVK